MPRKRQSPDLPGPNIRQNVEPDVRRGRERVEAFAERAHLIKVSDEDLTLLFPGEAPEAIARRWLQGSCELMLLTRGSAGAQLFSRRHGELYVAARTVAVCDTVGAGDTFQAALLSYLHEHGLDSPTELAKIKRGQLHALLDLQCRLRPSPAPGEALNCHTDTKLSDSWPQPCERL